MGFGSSSSDWSYFAELDESHLYKLLTLLVFGEEQ